MKEQKNNLGLVLSGGGFRGIAHIGVIKLLEELKITPTYISGTSAGAIVGALYAAGYSSDEMLNFFLNTKIFSWKNYAFRKAGILEPLKFASSLKTYFPEDRFEHLPKKLFIARTNLETGISEIIHKGNLVSNVMASAALPLMFAPVEIDGVLYADGGITNNFPIKPLQPFCNRVIGIYVNPLEMKKKIEFKRTYSVMERAFHISLAHSSIPKFQHCDVMIVPEKLKYHSLLDISHAKDIFKIGYDAALTRKKQLLSLMDKK